MIRIAVCDDDINLANAIEGDILRMDEKTLSCEVYQSGVELMRHLQGGEAEYHIYFMDIELPQQNGIETAAMIRKQDKDALIIFITDHKEYVYDVFEVLPFRFLRKPVSAQDIRRVLADAIEHLQRSEQIFFFQAGHEKYQLYCREILFFEGKGRKVIIHTKKQSYEVYDKVSDIMSRLDHSLFCRIHASYIVNMEYIRSVKSEAVGLQDGTCLPVSKRYRQDVKQTHLAFLERRCGL